MPDDNTDFDEDETEEPAPPAEIPEPRANPYLAGHEAAEAALLEAYAQGIPAIPSSAASPRAAMPTF